MESPDSPVLVSVVTPKSITNGGTDWNRQTSASSSIMGFGALSPSGPSVPRGPSGHLRAPLPSLLGMTCLAKQGDGHSQQDVSISRSNSPANSRREGDYLRSDSDSIMGEVQERISRMEHKLFILDSKSEAAAMSSVKTAQSGMLPEWGDESQGEDDHKKKKTCRIPFRRAIIATVILGALLTCVLTFLPLLDFTVQLQTETAKNFQNSVGRQFELIEDLSTRNALFLHRNILQRISGMVWETVLAPPDLALDALWGDMQAHHALDSSWTGASDGQRAFIAYRAFLELQKQQQNVKLAQKRQKRFGAADFLYVAFQGGRFTGTSLTSGPVEGRWWDCPGHAKTAEGAFAQQNISRHDPACGGAFPLERPWYRLQSTQSGPTRRLWSGLYTYLDGSIGLTKTAPVAYCGDYSCFQGVIAADITLQAVGQSCNEAFQTLKKELEASTYQFPIDPSNAMVFVVNHQSQAQRPGLLVGAAGLPLNQIVAAEDSQEVLVRSTSKEILRRFGTWDAKLLQEEQFFRFRQLPNGSAVDCGNEFKDFTDPDCLQVGTMSVELDEANRWMVIIVSPSVAFFSMAKHIEGKVSEELEAIDSNIDMMGMTILQTAAIAFLVTTVITVGIGFGLGTAVSSPMKELEYMLRRLAHFDFEKDESWLETEPTSSIREICELQDAFCRLAVGIKTFARFVPEAVVRNLIKGDPRAARLYVVRRVVTIMFSDIKDFTTMAEAISQKDLIFVLTRYLSIMTRIVETFGGVVAEILGDGLLVYWNTPHYTEDHPIRACAAALAMQQALAPLNFELSECGLSAFPLSVRIGINSGEVLSGTFGSDRKMKFGCMGDPVNLASRLENVCKAYGVGIIISGITYDAIADFSFITRKLDMVQVKGRKEPTVVYELMGSLEPGFENLDNLPTSHEPPPVAQDTDLDGSYETEDDMIKTFSRSSKDTKGTRTTRKSNASRVSECFLQKTPSQAALEALEESRQSLSKLTSFNWTEVYKQKTEAHKATRRSRQPGGISNPCSPMPRSITSRSVIKNFTSLDPPDNDKLLELSRRYEECLELCQAGLLQEAAELIEMLLVDFPQDKPTIMLQEKFLCDQAEPSNMKGPINMITVMNEKN
ncbi:unnamed protein product [Durusdinium trenchii]|uniref:Adenylate cyclase 1 (ATP pyrophosphate-lyase 1) (Adenylyl cyclase 1) n=2 Tax=Durusdinium trenchii TaxID=1381693 RepID=A0ABP0JBK8_9DINO